MGLLSSSPPRLRVSQLHLVSNTLNHLAVSAGEPADNAAHFVDWLSSLTGNLPQVSFGVFGCGNRDWAQTYQRIPVLIDELLGERGARRIVQLGEGDASAADFFDRFDAWEATLWDVLAKASCSEHYTAHALK